MIWRLLLDDSADGAANMARDEALLTLHAAGKTPPTLRLYTWNPACLSLGRFQRSADVNVAACASAGVSVVRRPSGGRALLHHDEYTYAVVARTDNPVFAGHDSILGTYQQISAALLYGLRSLELPVELAPVERRRGNALSACFATPAAYEIVVNGRKLVGSAQTRRENTLLQHGAIPRTPHAAQLAALLTDPPADLAQRMITVNEAAQENVRSLVLGASLLHGFEAAWGVTLERGQWTSAELTLADELRATRYVNPDWTHAR